MIKTDQSEWIREFTDGEGCFAVSFNKREKLTTKVEARPSFSISQKSHSLKALENVKNFFNCGAICYSARDDCYKYEVRNLTEIVKKIIPHFEKYPLETAKNLDFKIFATICKDMNQGKHLNASGMKKIIKESYTMNSSGKRKYSCEEITKHVKD